MKSTSKYKIIEEPFNSFYVKGSFELLRRLKEENFENPFNLLKNWFLIRTFSITNYKLLSDYIHLLAKEQFDEN